MVTNNFYSPLFANENDAASYSTWESIVLGLFENFKFNYELLGTEPQPQEKGDVHPYYFLKEIRSYVASQYFFQEKNHVHFNSFLAYGNKFTAYPMGESQAYHHFTLETYQFVWHAPLLLISNWQETFPLVFSVKNNYFLESCNAAFLNDNRYLDGQEYPIICKQHGKYFNDSYFNLVSLPPSLLLKTFDIMDKKIKIQDTLIKTLNFCLKIFYASTLIQASLMEIFGSSSNKLMQIENLKDNWQYPSGENIKGLSLYKLNLLSFLYLSLHPAATVLCYGLYRNKYGVMQSHRTAFYVRDNGKIMALKDFLSYQVQTYICFLNDFLLANPLADEALVNEIILKVKAALDLARIYGIGYETNAEKGKNVHLNSPKDFKPLNLSPILRDINFIVEHFPASPFWRIFYDYSGQWWGKEEMEEVLLGRGENWEKLKNLPRSFAVHIFHKITARFWEKTLSSLNLPPKMTSVITNRYKQVLGKEP